MPADATRTDNRRRPSSRRRGPPSPLLLFLPPLLITAGTVAVAAVHATVGAPLGPAFAAEVWALAKTFVAASLALGGFSGYVHANNRRAWAALDAAPQDPGARGGFERLPGAPRPITTRATGSVPAVTDTMRRRRTGRLTPVANDVPPGDADVADAPEAPARQANGGKGSAGR